MPPWPIECRTVLGEGSGRGEGKYSVPHPNLPPHRAEGICTFPARGEHPGGACPVLGERVRAICQRYEMPLTPAFSQLEREYKPAVRRDQSP
jgi:hypothetical protein